MIYFDRKQAFLITSLLFGKFEKKKSYIAIMSAIIVADFLLAITF